MSDKQERGKAKPFNGKMIRSNKTVTNEPADKFPPDHNDIDNPIDKEEANPDGTGNKDRKLTDDYSSVQEVALGELDTSENKKEELSESTEEEESETEKKDNDLKELKNDHETWNKTGLRERHPSKPLKPHDAAAGSICSIQKIKVHDAAGGSVHKSPILKDLQDDIKPDSPNSLCTFVLIGLVVLIFGCYWVVVKQSDNKQIQFQLISCNTNLDRAHEIIKDMTQQLAEMTKAKELADKSAEEKEKELNKLLDDMTRAKELADKSAGEKEKELNKLLDDMTKAKELADKSAGEKEKELNKLLDDMTRAKDESNKAKELADKSLQDMENARKTTEEQLNQLKQQVQLLMTQKTTAEKKIKEKEREIAEKDEKIVVLTAECNHHHHHHHHHKKGHGKGKCRHKHRHRR